MKYLNFFLIVWLLSSCSGISPEQKLGAEKMTSGQYAEALASLEAAKQAGHTNDELYLQLSEAKFKYSQDDLSKAQSHNKNDLPGAIALLQRAETNAQGALDELALIPETPENLKNSESKKELLKKVQTELKVKMEEKNKLVSRAQAIKANTKAKVESNYLDCSQLSPFKEYIPEVKDAYDFISEQLINELSGKGWAAFDSQKNSEAKNSFEKILKYFPGHTKGVDGVQCLKIQEGNKKQEFKNSYLLLQELKKNHPGNTCLTKVEKGLIEKLIKSEMNLASKKEKEKKISSAIAAIDHYTFLINLPELSEEQRKDIAKKITDARTLAASLLVSRAKALQGQGKESLPLVWNLLRWAYRYDPLLTEKNKSLMEESLKYILDKKEFKTLLVVKKGTNEFFNDLENQIKKQLVTASPTPANTDYITTFANELLDEDALKGVKQVQDFSRAPASVKKQIGGYDYFLWVNLLDYQAEEYGANQPFYKSSRYISGTRMLDNPDWFAAQQEFNSAQQEYNNNYQTNQQMMSQCNNMSNPFAAGICKGAWSGISTARLDRARATFNSTPRYIQENVISDYTYRQYKVGVNLYMRLEEKLYNNRKSLLHPPKVMEYKVTRKEGEILEGVQPSDINGIKEGRFSVPELQSEKRLGHEKLAMDLQSDLNQVATKEKGLRYCYVKGLKKESEVMASYQLCLVFIKNIEEFKDKPEYIELQNAQKKLSQYYQVTAEEIQKYALSEAELPKSEANIFVQELN